MLEQNLGGIRPLLKATNVQGLDVLFELCSTDNAQALISLRRLAQSGQNFKPCRKTQYSC